MNLDRIREYVTITVVTTLGIVFAIMAGRMAGSGQMNLILALLGSFAVIGVALSFRQSIWLFIPAAWVFEGQLPFLTLPFTVRDLIIFTVVATFCMFLALKIVRVQRSFGFLDFLIFLNLFYLLSVFLRNPVGVSALDSEKVGGRPYLTVFTGFLSYVVLRFVTPTQKEFRLYPWIYTGSNVLLGVLNIVAYLVPWTAPIMARFYTGITQEGQLNATVGGNDRQRLNQLSNLGMNTANLLCSLYRPLTLLMPWFLGRFTLFTFSMVAVFFSGHRSVLLYVMLFFALASYYRKRMDDAIRVGLTGFAMLSLLILLQGRLFELPFAVQRTLSWLPGDWSYEAVSDAQGSTEWRVEMWKIALTDRSYINNILIGDGFGFTHWELGIIHAADSARLQGIDVGITSQEAALRVGNYHSGPVSTIKIVGVVGLILYAVLFTSVAVYAHRLLVRARGTPLFEVALFLCIPNIYFPFVFIAVFGGFDPAFAITLLTVGLLQLFERALGQVENTRQAGATPRPRRIVRTRTPSGAPELALPFRQL